MKILIVENEIYLAQSIASKLTTLGYHCDIATTIKDALTDEKYDSVLLSTNVSGQNFYPVIKKHQSSIIILMISYISNDTVSNPIKAGANDYIQKPFMIEELVRKLKHLNDFDMLEKENNTYKDYLAHTFESTNLPKINTKVHFPAIIKTNSQKMADALVFDYCANIGKSFTFISLTSSNAIEQILRTKQNEIIYLVDLQKLKKSEKTKVFNAIEDKRVFISTTDSTENAPYFYIEVNNNNKILNQGEILSIDDYVKYIILNFQSKFPDTELSKKLGISRKSLWEKRKKYGINKKV
ncbi:response regulator [Sulfurospirillum sp. 1612]|uniref:response regulator n=1 Tax=Sulfurospirillum sp. 1612 TaxID=3094835 RepID=UPI002F92A62C